MSFYMHTVNKIMETGKNKLKEEGNTISNNFS